MCYMDSVSTGMSIITWKGGKRMKKNSSIFNAILLSIASTFVIASDFIVNSGSVILWGEPKCPKDLLK